MNAGLLKDRIDILEQKISKTPFGDTRITYEPKYSCRAFVQYANGNRIVDNDEIFYSVDRTFIVRHYVPIVDTDMIVWNDKRWRVLSIDRNHQLNNIVINTTLVNE